MASDTTVKYFTSAMTGAPTLNNTAGALIAVLDACLVNGWGSQTCSSVVISGGVGTATVPTTPAAIELGVVLFAGATSPTALNSERKVTSVGANTIVFDASDLADGTVAGTITVKVAPAGWVKAFSGTNEAAFKSSNVAASGMYLVVSDAGTTVAAVRGYESLTSISNRINGFPLASQAATAVWPKSSSAATKNWWIVANDRCFYFGVAYSATYPSSYAIFCFGDKVSRRSGDPYRAMLWCLNADPGASVGNAYSPVGTTIVTSSLRYAARSYSGLGSPIVLTPTWLDAAAGSGLSGYSGRAFPNPADNGVIFSPFLLLEGSGYRGALPGCYAAPQAIQSGLADGAVINSVPDFARPMMYRRWAHTADTAFGGVFFDLGGPWDN